MFLKVIHSFFLSVRGLFRDIKSDIKTSKEHFTVNIKQNKAKRLFVGFDTRVSQGI